jgi:hypothetical protein
MLLQYLIGYLIVAIELQGKCVFFSFTSHLNLLNDNLMTSAVGCEYISYLNIWTVCSIRMTMMTFKCVINMLGKLFFVNIIYHWRFLVCNNFVYLMWFFNFAIIDI